MVWPEQLQIEPPRRPTWPEMRGKRPLSAWPDLIAPVEAGHRSCGDSGSLSARDAAEPWPDLPPLGCRKSSAHAPTSLGARLSHEIALFASGLLREEQVERLDSIRDEIRAGERGVPCCDRCGDFTCALAGPPPSEVVHLTLAPVGFANASPLPGDAPLSTVEGVLLPRPGSGGMAAEEAVPAMVPETVPETVPELVAMPVASDDSRAAPRANELPYSRPLPFSRTPPSPPPSPPPPPPLPPQPTRAECSQSPRGGHFQRMSLELHKPGTPPPRVVEVHRGPLTCLTCQVLPGVDYRALKAAPPGDTCLTCCAVRQRARNGVCPLGPQHPYPHGLP